jgi:hypothetical protein
MRLGVSGWISLALALGCSENDRVVFHDPMPGPEASSTDPAPVGVEPSPATPPVPASPPSPDAGDGNDVTCTNRVEFRALGVVPDNYGQSWGALDPNSGYAYWSHGWSGNDLRISSFRWTATAGVQILADQAEPQTDEVDLSFRLVSTDGGTVLGTRYSDQPSADGFRWTPETGMSWLDFEPVDMTPDARTAVGFRERVPVRWVDGVGATELDPTWSALNPTVENLRLSRSGDVVLASGYFAGRSFRWTAATGSRDLGQLDGAPSKTLAYAMSDSGDVIAGTADYAYVEPARAFRWTQASGLRDLGAVPGAPEGASTSVIGISADGSTIIGQVALDSSFAHVFRWTEAGGMQDLVPGNRKAQATYVSPLGDVVIGYFWSDVGSAAGGFRWTEATGAMDVNYTTPLGIGADGDLLVGNTSQGPSIETFGKLAGTTPDLVRLMPGLVPDDWSSPQLSGASRDGRLLVGEAINPNGQQEPWLLHLVQVCPGQ